MSILLLGVTLLLGTLYAHFSSNVEKYGNSGNLLSRTIVLFSGLVFGAGGTILLRNSIADPTWALGSGFVVGPLLAVAATVYLVVAIFFPLEQVRGLLRYSFRHKFNDDIRA